MPSYTCKRCGNSLSATSFECPRCGAAGPNLPGRPRQGLSRPRWTALCVLAVGLTVAFPPMRQAGEFSIDGRTVIVDHEAWPAWIGMASDEPDIGYARNGQLETVYWNITRSINRPVWHGLFAILGVVWVVGMAWKRKKPVRPVSRYPQVVSAQPPTPVPAPRAPDRQVQPPARQGGPVYPGLPSDLPWANPYESGQPGTPKPGGRYR